MPTWAIVPVKPFRESKSRLSGVLSTEERAHLSRIFLSHTLNVLKEVPAITRTMVVSRDGQAQHVARDHGAFTIAESSAPELNSALARATDVVLRLGASAVVILPSDLPLMTADDILTFISRAATAPGICIAPDRRGSGTNALLICPPKAIPYAFGVRSFQKHLELAREHGVHAEVCELPSLALDVDLPEDLELYQSSSQIAK